jgi:hypothetical protein
MIEHSWRKSLIGKFGAAVLFLAGASQAFGSTVYMDQPTAVTGAPGDTVGWSFTIYNPTNLWVSFTDSSWAQLEPAVGDASSGQNGYTDYIGMNGGPTDYAIAPLSTWTESFSVGSVGTGIGQFVIAASAPDAAQDTGLLTIHYDTYDADPLSGGNWVGSYTLTLQDGTTLPTLTVDVQTPEPAATAPLGVLAAGWAVFALRRRRVRQ